MERPAASSCLRPAQSYQDVKYGEKCPTSASAVFVCDCAPLVEQLSPMMMVKTVSLHWAPTFLWLLSLYVLCAQRASIWILSIIRAVCKWTETEHKSNSSCSDENKTKCKASIFHSSSPVEDQNFVLDGFSLQASILPSPLWTQTASGEALGVWDMLGQTRVHGRVTADGWVREKTNCNLKINMAQWNIDE